jgi:hypothetical protein
VTYRPIARQRLGKHIPAEAYERNNRKGIGRSVFYVGRAMPIARQRVSKHISAEENARNTKTSLLGNGEVNMPSQQ